MNATADNADKVEASATLKHSIERILQPDVSSSSGERTGKLMLSIMSLISQMQAACYVCISV